MDLSVAVVLSVAGLIFSVSAVLTHLTQTLSPPSVP